MREQGPWVGSTLDSGKAEELGERVRVTGRPGMLGAPRAVVLLCPLPFYPSFIISQLPLCPWPVSAKHYHLQKCSQYTGRAGTDAWLLGQPDSSLLASEPAPRATACPQGPGPREIHSPEAHCCLCPWGPLADHHSRAAAKDLELPPSFPLPNPPNLPREPPLSELPGVS